MLSRSFLAKLLENEVLRIQMKFETKLRNYIISKEQKYFVRTTRLFCQATQRILFSQKMILLVQQKSFVRLTKRPNKKKFLDQRNSFVVQITTKLFFYRKKIWLVKQNRFLNILNTFGKFYTFSRIILLM